MKKIKISKFNRRLLYFLGITGLTGALLCWLAPHFVNKKALNTHLRQWLETVFAYTSPAEVETVDLALRMHGRADLYMEKVELDAPNPAFAFPWLQIDTVRASAPIYELWGGIRAAMRIQLRRPVLRLQWDNAGHGNLDGLRLEPSPVFPLPRVGPGDFYFEAMDGRIILEHPLLHGNVLLNGELALRTIGRDHMQVRNVEVDISFRGDSAQSWRRGRITLKKGVWHYETSPGMPTFELEAENLPLRLINLLAPAVPPIPNNTVADGTLTEHAGEMEFSGQIRGSGPLSPAVAFKLHRSREKNERLYSLQLARGAARKPSPEAVFSWTMQNGRAGTLRGNFSVIDDTADFWPPAPEWARWLAGIFPAAHCTIEELRLQGFRFSNVYLNVTPQPEDKLDVAAESVIAGGKLLLTAKGLPLTGGLPASFHTALDVPALGDTLLYFSGLLPPLFQVSPLRGRGQATLGYESGDDGKPALKLQLALQDVVVPTLVAGEALQALSNLASGMNELENLTRRAAVTPRPPLPAVLDDNSAPLHFSAFLAHYELAAGRSRLRGLEAVSPEIGKLAAFGEQTADGAFRLTIVLKEVPDALFSALSPAVATAARTIMAEDGLRIECLADSQGGTVERRYIQDIFRRWLENTR